MEDGARRIPSWPGAPAPTKAEYELRRPACHSHLSLAAKTVDHTFRVATTRQEHNSEQAQIGSAGTERNRLCRIEMKEAALCPGPYATKSFRLASLRALPQQSNTP